LQDVDGLLRAGGGGSRVPARLGQLERRQGLFPRGYAAVKSGEGVVLWGAALAGEGGGGRGGAGGGCGEKGPGRGGFVLLSAGTVKKMTPAEFNAAPRAKK